MVDLRLRKNAAACTCFTSPIDARCKKKAPDRPGLQVPVGRTPLESCRLPMVRCREVPGRTRRDVYRRLAGHEPYDSAGETIEKGGKQGIKEEGQEQSATAADR